jgi:hypothetical protein
VPWSSDLDRFDLEDGCQWSAVGEWHLPDCFESEVVSLYVLL